MNKSDDADVDRLLTLDAALRNQQRFKVAVRRKYRARRGQLRDQMARSRAQLVLDEQEELDLVDARIAELVEQIEAQNKKLSL